MCINQRAAVCVFALSSAIVSFTLSLGLRPDWRIRLFAGLFLVVGAILILLTPRDSLRC